MSFTASINDTKPVALVTGASSGIGAIYAERLARSGYDLIITARDEARLGSLADRLGASHGAKVSVLPADLSKPDDLARVADRIASDSSISLLINNAGMAVLGGLIDMPPETINALIQLNVTAAAQLAAAAGRAFAQRGSGAIVNIASVLALISERFNPIYNATKAFVLSLSQSMQHELGPKGIYIQAVLPGATRTEIWSRAGGDVNALPPEMVMDADEMVDAALAGFDAREAVTIPSLPDAADFERFTEARLALGPNLSRQHAAARYHQENRS